MKKIILLAALVAVGCENSKPMQKPFTVVGKNVMYEKGFGCYQYQDVNGRTREFSDTPDAYKIGDTIH